MRDPVHPALSLAFTQVDALFSVHGSLAIRALTTRLLISFYPIRRLLALLAAHRRRGRLPLSADRKDEEWRPPKILAHPIRPAARSPAADPDGLFPGPGLRFPGRSGDQRRGPRSAARPYPAPDEDGLPRIPLDPSRFCAEHIRHRRHH